MTPLEDNDSATKLGTLRRLELIAMGMGPGHCEYIMFMTGYSGGMHCKAWYLKFYSHMSKEVEEWNAREYAAIRYGNDETSRLGFLHGYFHRSVSGEPLLPMNLSPYVEAMAKLRVDSQIDDILTVMEGIPPGTRTKEDIDAQIVVERESYDLAAEMKRLQRPRQGSD